MSSFKLTNAQQIVLSDTDGYILDVWEYDERDDNYTFLTRLFGKGNLQEAVNNAIDQLMQENIVESYDDVATDDIF